MSTSKSSPFVHLHVHTSYSLLDGACQTKPLMEAVQAAHMPAVACTDHGVMYGEVEFYKAAMEKGIKPILGCEVYEAPGSRLEQKGEGGPKAAAYHLVLLAADETGYSNLIRLVSSAHLEGFYYKPRIDREILARHAKGLIGLSGCLKGRVSEDFRAGGTKAALQSAGVYADILGKDNFFLELQDEGLDEQPAVNAGFVDLAKRTGLPLVATNDVHYLKREHAAAHDVLLCIQTAATVKDPNRLRYGSDQFYLRSGAEMAELFREAPQALANTLEIAQRCTVTFNFKDRFFPTFAPPAGHTPPSYLGLLCREGLTWRYGIADPEQPKNDHERTVVERLNFELGVIEKTGFVGYFLVVWDFVRFAREHKVPVGPGRGSGAGSLVAYCLGITGVDPLHYNLLFERFLNPDRVSPPDFDIDFCQDRRGEVIEYVKEKYHRENVAQIITFGSLGAKTLIRDIGRALEIPLADCNRLAKLVPEEPDIDLASAQEKNPDFRAACAGDPAAREIMKYAPVLEGLLRNVGVHAAGVVIGARPLVEMIPLARDKNKEVVTQYSKDHVEALGLLKADFLGLKTLTVMTEAVALIQARHGVAVDIDKIPMDDAQTFELLRRAETIGVFQLESRGMRDLCRRVGLARIEDLIALIALFRPGPMQFLDDFIDRKNGKVRVTYDDPHLQPILAETYGIIVYQEQIQQAARVLAGYTLAQGDLLRRAMAKKKHEEMEKQRGKFVEGCKKTCGIGPEKGERIFNTIAKFAEYGFNKSHSTGYAIVAMQTAWFKAHYPAEFMAALISSVIGATDKLPVFLNEAEAMGLEVLPPDVNAGGVRFMPGDKSIRFGLAGIKNIGEGAAAAIVAEREKGGPYKNLFELCQRLDPRLINRKVLETLVKSGACDGLGGHRAQLFGAIDMVLARAASQHDDRLRGQGSLFAMLDETAAGGAVSDALPDVPPWHESELLAHEKQLLTIYLSGHPLTHYEPLLRRYRLTTMAELRELEPGTVTRLGGIIAAVTRKTTRQGKRMAAVQVEDVDGSIEAVMYEEQLDEFGSALAENAPVMMCGEVRPGLDEESVGLMILELYPLDQVPRLFTERIALHLPAVRATDELLGRIRELLQAQPGGTPVSVCLQFPTGGEVFVETGRAFRVTPEPALIRELEQAIGEESVYVAVIKRPCRKATSGERSGFRRRF